MPKRIVAEPESGFPGQIEERGTWVQGVYRMVAYVYGPDELAPTGIDRATITELRAKYWDPARQALVIPLGSRHTFELGHELLTHVPDTAVIHVRPEFSYPHEGPPPKECSCGTLSFRHAIEFHDSNAAAH